MASFGEEKTAKIRSIVVLDHDQSKILASADERGRIKLWSLETYQLTGTFKALSATAYSLQVLRFGGKICLVCPGDNMTIKVWDVQTNTPVAILTNFPDVREIKIFRNGEKACLASTHINGDIKLLME